MNHPGLWIMGDTSDDDRNHGMGIVVEYANRTGKAQWISPPSSKWNYAHFGNPSKAPKNPDETFDMIFTKTNAADHGFNSWEINGIAYPNTMAAVSPQFHPTHLHRHVFELASVAGQETTGIMKDVVMVGGYQAVDVDFVANNPGLTLFHCHQQLHMDFGFMTLFDYV
jgi:FtsP/CotA-like multicopper oxidase with cupredoxin domain